MVSILPRAAAALLLACALPAFAADDVQQSERETEREATSAKPEATKKAQERRICRNIRPTGSRMGREEICLTEAQWRKAGY